jgi:hypothetical protein
LLIDTKPFYVVKDEVAEAKNADLKLASKKTKFDKVSKSKARSYTDDLDDYGDDLINIPKKEIIMPENISKYNEDKQMEKWDPLRESFVSVKNNYFFNEKSAEARIYGIGRIFLYF